jgi:hypothetical protein
MSESKPVVSKETKTEPLVKGLGVRINKIAIVNEKDCIKLKPKGWMEKKDWREINDIVRAQGFNWLANGRDSCWMKVENDD